MSVVQVRLLTLVFQQVYHSGDHQFSEAGSVATDIANYVNHVRYAPREQRR